MDRSSTLRRLEVEFLVKLYRFYEDNYYYLEGNKDFEKVIEAQEEKVTLFIYKTGRNKEEN